MKTNKTKKTKPNFFQKLIGNVAENVKEGALLVGEKVTETSAKAYVASTELVTETSEKIHEYTEKQTLLKEEKIILEQQQQLKLSFGDISLNHYLINDSLHKSFLTTKAVKVLVEKYKSNEKRIVAIHKEIKKIENHIK